MKKVETKKAAPKAARAPAAAANKPAAAAESAGPAGPRPLWPQPIPVIGVTGKKWSGKTTFAVSIAGPDTLVYDSELSSESYAGDIGFDRVDVMKEMHRLYPGGHKPIQRFVWWRDHVRSVPTGKYRVIVLDTVNEIETGLADWVKANPAEFGHTPAQYTKMSGLMWSDVKDYWLNMIASDLAGRCETFVFVTHLGFVWGADNKPTGKTKPKGKETLFQVASLYLELRREADAKGNMAAVPSAVVLKDRIARMRFDKATGAMSVKPLLPPRLPVATPAAIREYMVRGGLDFDKLDAGERAPDESLTDDDRAVIRLATAEAERDAEQARLARVERAAAGTTSVRTPSIPIFAGCTTQPMTVATSQVPAGPTPEQLDKLARLRERLWEAAGDADEDARQARWSAILARRNVVSALHLTPAQADELIGALAERLNAAEPLDGVFTQGSPAGGVAQVDAAGDR